MKKIIFFAAILFSTLTFSQNFSLELDGNQIILTNTSENHIEFNSSIVPLGYYIKDKDASKYIIFYQNNLTRHIGRRGGYEISEIENASNSQIFTETTIKTFLHSNLTPSSDPIVVINSNNFKLIKGSANNSPANKSLLEINDFVYNGFFSPTQFILMAKFSGGDANLTQNFSVITELEY